MKLNHNLKILLFLFVPALCVFGIEFLNSSYPKSTLYILYAPLIIVTILAFILPLFCKITLKREYPIWITPALFFVVWGVLSYSFLSIFINFLILLSVVLILLGITKRYDISLITTMVISFVLGQLNSYVIRFRGFAISWADINSVGTAKNVFINYDYSLTQNEWIVLIMYLVLTLLVIMSKEKKVNINIPGRIISSILGCVFITILLFTDIANVFSIKESLFYKHSNGLILNQLLTLDKYFLKLPEDYSLECLEELSEYIDTESGKEDKNIPQNIIVIMNESFSDFSFSDYIELNNIYTLKENTISGTAYSSVFGGNTANSEYEFLTNNSMMFLNQALVPYTLNIVNSETPSIVKSLNSLGYETVAFHPWLKSGWNRPTTYKDLGFEKQLFLNDFETVELFGEYPSDKWNYEQVINLYKNKNKEKLFVFNITIQNHSPNEDIKRSIEDADQNIMNLIDYFSKEDENTMIVFFGDHQFMMENEFYIESLGKGLNDLYGEEKEELYKVPFFIWANYDIEEKEDVQISFNYLSMMMLDEANIPLNKYQKYLKDLYSELPVIHANGIWDSDGEYYESYEQLPADLQTKINNYKNMQYNTMIDTENLVKELFSK